MRCFCMALCRGMLVLACAASTAKATDTAADGFAKNTKASSKPASAKERALAQFDTNGDGKLSEAERRAARTSLQKQRRVSKVEEEQSASQSTTAAPAGGLPLGGMNPYLSNGGYPMSGYPQGSASYFFYAGGTVTGSGQLGGAAGGQCMGMGSTGMTGASPAATGMGMGGGGGGRR